MCFVISKAVLLERLTKAMELEELQADGKTGTADTSPMEIGDDGTRDSDSNAIAADGSDGGGQDPMDIQEEEQQQSNSSVTIGVIMTGEAGWGMSSEEPIAPAAPTSTVSTGNVAAAADDVAPAEQPKESPQEAENGVSGKGGSLEEDDAAVQQGVDAGEGDDGESNVNAVVGNGNGGGGDDTDQLVASVVSSVDNISVSSETAAGKGDATGDVRFGACAGAATLLDAPDDVTGEQSSVAITATTTTAATAVETSERADASEAGKGDGNEQGMGKTEAVGASAVPEITTEKSDDKTSVAGTGMPLPGVMVLTPVEEVEDAGKTPFSAARTPANAVADAASTIAVPISTEDDTIDASTGGTGSVADTVVPDVAEAKTRTRMTSSSFASFTPTVIQAHVARAPPASSSEDTYAYEEEQERLALLKSLHQPMRKWFNEDAAAMRARFGNFPMFWQASLT